MKIYIKNANIISMDETRPKIEENMDILIEDGKIQTIGKNIETEENSKVIYAKGKIVMPGMINTHAHVPMSIFRETVDGYSLQEWLNQKIWPMEDKLTNEDIEIASTLSFIEMIKTGTTTINDMYFTTDEIIKAAVNIGVRLQTTRTLMDAGSKELGEDRLKELQELIEKYKDYNELITLNVGIHGLYTSSREYVRECINLAKENGLLVHMHFCENTKEVQDIKDAYNENPVDVLEKEFKDLKIVLAHAVKLSEEEIERIAKNKNISVSHCPVSNLKLGCGIANVSKMLEAGINVTLGTDGQGSGSNLDLFEVAKFSALLQKGIKEDAKKLTSYEVLKMATINGAKALGLEDKIGSITEGKMADLIILNLDTAVSNPVNDICSDIVYNAKGSNVETTIINGKIVMENKKVLQDENMIFKKCKEIIDRIKI